MTGLVQWRARAEGLPRRSAAATPWGNTRSSSPGPAGPPATVREYPHGDDFMFDPGRSGTTLTMRPLGLFQGRRLQAGAAEALDPSVSP